MGEPLPPAPLLHRTDRGWLTLDVAPLSALTPGGPVSLGASLSNHKTVGHFLKNSGVAPREFE